MKHLLTYIFIYILTNYILLNRFMSYQNRIKRGLILIKTKIWTDGVIPYTIDRWRFSNNENEYIIKAIETWNTETCLNFRSYVIGDKNWINISQIDGCYSQYVGMGQGGVQDVSLESPGCTYYGSILHELGHVAGLSHEQQRADRDRYIFVNDTAIKKIYMDQFDKYDLNETHSIGTPYDFQSIMHYDQKAFADITDDITMSTIDSELRELIRHPSYKDLSFRDAKIINKLYNCQRKCKTNIKCKQPGYMDKFCECQTPETFQNRRCVNELEDSVCFSMASKLECFNKLKYMSIYCRKTCNFCYQFDETKSGIMKNYPCDDFRNDCKQLEQQNYCKTEAQTMRIQCPKTCGMCNDPILVN